VSIVLPKNLRTIRFFRLSAGTALHRNHDRAYPGALFNPCLGAPTRFAPIHDDAGTCIPTLYAATTFDGAAYETIFRGIPSPYSAVPRQVLDTRGVSILRLRRDMDLVPFFTPELRGWGIDPEEFFRPAATAYASCRALAVQAWREFPNAHGTIWSSIRDSSAQAILLFGDRVSPADFDCAPPRHIDTDAGLLDEFLDAGARAGFLISR
jgi:hypothetical protein